uniref:AlNc14C96G5863 protein n=1 Tax=Albugo laibachii Nc14 TaxID=890382 RepID=F0WGY7_9STRA|nr:AlNc14C96G5863 [Albugo laibachii Nc14]|eukprot:CCA20502.1 AlNc14C96G5863 [Albugo laibachii Nc14]
MYARSLKIVLVKVPPGLTWLCQPADAVWIKHMKDRLRRHWLLHLQGQISDHRTRPTALTVEVKDPDRAEVARWASNAWKDILTSMIVAGFAHCKLGVGYAAAVEPDEEIEMQELIDAVVKDLAELSVVDPRKNVLDNDQDVVDQSADMDVSNENK